MSTSSNIEWTGATWNPVTGRTKISPGCKQCYAARPSKQLQAMRERNYANGPRTMGLPRAPLID